MFTLEETEIAKAIERAKQFHPKVRMITFGQYAVTATKGEHVVCCYRDEQGQKVVDCDCKTRDGLACRCGVAAVSLHIGIAALRRAA
jgi:hypothetical protein